MCCSTGILPALLLPGDEARARCPCYRRSRMIRSLRSAILCIAVFGCASTTSSTTKPASQPVAEESAEASSRTNYSDEKYRIVNNADEVVAVLENGATVIAKHVDSPVVAMRAYTY